MQKNAQPAKNQANSIETSNSQSSTKQSSNNSTQNQSHRIMLIPVGFGVGLTSVALGLLHSCEQKGIKVGHFKPISQPSRNSLAKKNKP